MSIRTMVLFGAGQVGCNLVRQISERYEPLCFADNSKDKQGTTLAGLDVVSLEEAIRRGPDAVCICVLDAERETQMLEALDEQGFAGERILASVLKTFDARIATMRLFAEQAKERGLPGDIAEAGVYRGDFAAQMSRAFPERTIHLYDTFSGFDAGDLTEEERLGLRHPVRSDFSDTSEAYVLARMPFPEKVLVHAGHFPESFQETDRAFVFVDLDFDLYEPTKAALPLFWECLTTGGAMIVHDYNSQQFPGVREAVDPFCEKMGLSPFPLCDLHGSILLKKER